MNEAGTGYDRGTRSFVTPSLEIQKLPSEYNRLGAPVAATAKRAAEAALALKARIIFNHIENEDVTEDGDRQQS